ncbi:hypothetical protein [Lentzea sp. NPDC059081]|uniref:hypothetical protein n=1 Tax=Lentzea sp. NPDC059081 TaxID=3346719 RepID=UPI0036B976EF
MILSGRAAFTSFSVSANGFPVQPWMNTTGLLVALSSTPAGSSHVSRAVAAGGGTSMTNNSTNTSALMAAAP